MRTRLENAQGARREPREPLRSAFESWVRFARILIPNHDLNGEQLQLTNAPYLSLRLADQ